MNQTNNVAWVSSAEGAAMLGISKPAFSGLATRRDWTRIKRDKGHYYARADIEQELAIRAEPANSRVPPVVVAHTKKCADRIRDYWRDRGHRVSVEVNGGEILSDLVNGLPR